jgi:hypothetical protein
MLGMLWWARSILRRTWRWRPIIGSGHYVGWGGSIIMHVYRNLILRLLCIITSWVWRLRTRTIRVMVVRIWIAFLRLPMNRRRGIVVHRSIGWAMAGILIATLVLK